MSLMKLYALARELARDLVFEIDGEVVTLSVKGVLLVKIPSDNYNFSFFEVTEQEFILAIQMGGYMVYLGIEADDEVEEEAYPMVVRTLIAQLIPDVNALIREAKKVKYAGPGDMLLDDNMSPDLKEAMYDILMRHRRGITPYEQVEVA
ncbi:hypothetical protein [Pyrococcus yayanosii]|uniref:Uncharacterized protein n=1 Tax=Pyrococcus yayanosii (strain CH1 / JCM 16557) TaxID=529709 RepID=F8AIV3_PYRYC|nr:hypothetical protein [Pyrococcus yayanosii]AEH24428.1 hypothetical protein PYCH_07410 [Pyrococcus yayanosii CH1]